MQGKQAAGLWDRRVRLHLQHLQRSHPQVMTRTKNTSHQICLVTSLFSSSKLSSPQWSHHKLRREGDREEDGWTERLQRKQLPWRAVAVPAEVEGVVCCLR